MKLLRVLLATLAVAVMISDQAEAGPQMSLMQLAQAAPAVSGYCQGGAHLDRTATTTATAIAGGGTWTTITNDSTTVDLLCDFCSGFSNTYPVRIGRTTTAHFPLGVASIQATSDVICCKVAAATLAYGVRVGRNCP